MEPSNARSGVPAPGSTAEPLAPRLAKAAADAVVALREAPPLALLAAVAALFELSLARIGWHGLTDLLDPTELIELRRWARFPRNLAAVSGMVALTAALLAYLRLPGFAPIGRRLAVAAFSGIFIPSLLVATFLPGAELRRRLVIFGLAAANVLVTLVGMSAIRYRSGAALRAAILLLTLTAFSVLTVVGLGQLVQAEAGVWAPLADLLARHPTTTERALLTMRHLGELSWMGVLLGASWTAVSAGGGALRRRWLIAGCLTLIGALLVLSFQQLVGHRFRLALFGSFRLGLLIDHMPALYALPLSIGAVGGAVGLSRSAPAVRQLGVGIWLWLAAGYGPHTLIQLLYLVLGAVLLIRAAQALDPKGAWRAHQPFSRFAPPG